MTARWSIKPTGPCTLSIADRTEAASKSQRRRRCIWEKFIVLPYDLFLVCRILMAFFVCLISILAPIQYMCAHTARTESKLNDAVSWLMSASTQHTLFTKYTRTHTYNHGGRTVSTLCIHNKIISYDRISHQTCSKNLCEHCRFRPGVYVVLCDVDDSGGGQNNYT